jgi:hypothetical protein
MIQMHDPEGHATHDRNKKRPHKLHSSHDPNSIYTKEKPSAAEAAPARNKELIEIVLDVVCQDSSATAILLVPLFAVVA